MKKKILVVDDNQTLRENLKALLERAGYEVKSTGENEEIWSLLREEFDLMILDLIFPDKNTSVILGGIKSCSPQMRVVIYSGYEEYKDSPYIRQADAFVGKSETTEALLATIKKFLGE